MIRTWSSARWSAFRWAIRPYAENVYSYCWPESADNLACDIDAVALAQPIHNVPISKGDEVRFVIQGEAGPPRQVHRHSAGWSGRCARPQRRSGVFDVQLLDNLYRVQVDAEYNGVEGKPAYVSYVFGLEVAGIIVPTPTPVPTDTPNSHPANRDPDAHGHRHQHT